jgi:uncharacterized integral membrane protein
VAASPPAASTDPRKVASMRGGAAFGWAALALVALGVLLILLLHVLPPSNQVNPVTRTISEYALGANRWIFDLALFALAVGTVGVLAGLVRAGVARAFGAASLLILTWAVCLVLLVVFQKYNYATDNGVGLGGRIHRMATLVGFLSLPVGALLVPGGDGMRTRRARRWTRTASVVALLSFGPLCWAVAQGLLTGVAWWRVFPLGAVERLMALTEMAVLAALGRWAIAGGRLGRADSDAQPVR